MIFKSFLSMIGSKQFPVGLLLSQNYIISFLSFLIPYYMPFIALSVLFLCFPHCRHHHFSAVSSNSIISSCFVILATLPRFCLLCLFLPINCRFFLGLIHQLVTHSQPLSTLDSIDSGAHFPFIEKSLAIQFCIKEICQTFA